MPQSFVLSNEGTYYSVIVDLDLLVESVKFIKKLMTSGPLAEYHQEFCQPGPDVKTDEQIKEWVTKYSESQGLLVHFLYV